MRKTIIITALYLFITLLTFAQDARFSQPWTAPLMINPALSGNFDGYLRIGALSSWQQTELNKTAHQYAYLDNRLNRRNEDSSINSYWGFGLSYYQYGDDPFGLYKSRTPINGTFTAFTLAYHFNIDKSGNHSMGVGAQIANASGKADERRGIYDKEITGGGFNFLNLRQGGTNRGNKSYVDANLGMFYRFRNEGVLLETGFSMYHLFYPNNAIIYKDNESKENHRGVAHITLDVKLNPRNSLVFRNIYFSEGLYWRSKTIDNNQIIANWFGVELQRTRPVDNVFAHLGLYTRSLKTIIPYASFYIGRNINIRGSYEQPINSKYNLVSYTAKRAEIAAVLTFFDRDKATRRNFPENAVNW